MKTKTLKTELKKAKILVLALITILCTIFILLNYLIF